MDIKKQEYEQLIALRTKGAIIRSRSRWVEEGEKNTKYFFNLEKRNYANKTISCLNVNDVLIEDPKDIREDVKQFYQRLYTSDDHNINSNELFICFLPETKCRHDLCNLN